MKLQILHKGLILIFIPLLIQLVFFAQLFSLVSQVEELERQEESRTMLMEASDQVIMEFGTTWTTIICKLFGSTAYTLDPEAYKAHMDSLFKRFRPIEKDFPRFKALMDEAALASDDQYELFKELRTASPEPDSHSALPFLSVLKFRPKFMRISGRGLELKQSMEREIAFLNDSYKKNESKRVNLKQQIFFGICADFIISVLFLLAFLSDITRRLKILVANAALIPTNKPLTERVSGSDELAMLDSVLHGAAAELQQAKEYRTSLMEMVAHDLRSPLTAAKSTVELLLNSTIAQAAEQQSHLERLRRNLIRLIAFVEDLLTIDRLESEKLELDLSLFKIQKVVEDCVESLAAKAESRKVQIFTSGENFEVVADQARISQVIMNLLTNAINHSPDGGVVAVQTSVLDDFVKITIIDHGRGIARSEQKRIFEKFSRGQDKQVDGYGLGLAICKLIIDAHQGTIGINSAVGKGAEFWFALPDDQGDAV